MFRSEKSSAVTLLTNTVHVVQDFTDNVDFLKQSDHDLIQGSHAILLPLIEQKKLLNLEPYFEAFGRANRILHDQYTAPLMMTLPLLFCKKGEISSVPKNWNEFFALNRKLKAEGKYSACPAELHCQQHRIQPGRSH